MSRFGVEHLVPVSADTGGVAVQLAARDQLGHQPPGLLGSTHRVRVDVNTNAVVLSNPHDVLTRQTRPVDVQPPVAHPTIVAPGRTQQIGSGNSVPTWHRRSNRIQPLPIDVPATPNERA